MISGGPSVGKTSVIDELSSRGYNTIEEGARRVAMSDKRFIGKPLDQIDRKLFQEAIFEIQKTLFDVDYDLAFSDRGFGDTIGYYPVIGFEVPEYMIEHAKRNIPDHVFILDPLPEFEIDEFRNDVHDQLKLQESFARVYESLGCKVITVPAMSIGERVDFILERVKFNN